PLLEVLLDQHGDLVRRLGADADPVLDPGRLERYPLVGVLDVRVVRAQLLDDPPIPGLPAIDGHDAEVVTVLAPHLLHSDANGHGGTFPSKTTARAAAPCPRAR